MNEFSLPIKNKTLGTIGSNGAIEAIHLRNFFGSIETTNSAGNSPSTVSWRTFFAFRNTDLVARRTYLVSRRTYLVSRRTYLVSRRTYLVSQRTYLVSRRTFMFLKEEFLELKLWWITEGRAGLSAWWLSNQTPWFIARLSIQNLRQILLNPERFF